MASKNPKKSSPAAFNQAFGFSLTSIFSSISIKKQSFKDFWNHDLRGFVVLLNKTDNAISSFMHQYKELFSPYQLTYYAKKKSLDFLQLQCNQGPIWLISEDWSSKLDKHKPISGNIEKNRFARLQDYAGQIGQNLEGLQLSELVLFSDKEIPSENWQAIALGLEVGSYKYLKAMRPNSKKPSIQLFCNQATSEKFLQEGLQLGLCKNFTRHLVNTPAQDLNPKSICQNAEPILRKLGLKVEVWNEKKIVAEKMGLLAAVGKAAAETSQFLILQYRHPQLAKSVAPLALVGKGVTFDTGGLDIKPSDGMRLMKKDMAGAATLLGQALWLGLAKPKAAVNIYLPFAENAVNERAMRPGDVFTSRKGLSVEITNTDAEGRLVLADALDVALNDKSNGALPSAIINLATLTGAARVALGTKIAATFSNNDDLFEKVATSMQQKGEILWRLPLYQDYADELKSPFAELSNSALGRFGGAITAALFLQKFIQNIPWVHFDFYGWTEKTAGALAETGGSGQLLVGLSRFIEDYFS